MDIKIWTVGPMENNVYLLTNESKKSIIIDPAWAQDLFVEEAKTKYKPIGLIILTHGHFDHCLSAAFIKDKTGAEIWIHEDDVEYLEKNVEKARQEFGIEFTPTVADKTLKDGELIEWGGEKIKVIHTPGHTPGGICLLMDKKMITGDTLFAGSVGRWDFSGGNGKLLFTSIRERLLTLPEDIVIYPGHGTTSTIGKEKKSNYLLKMSDAELGLI